MLGHICRGIVATAFRCAVTGEVLGASGDRVGRPEILGLESFDHGNREPACEMGILARTFGYAAPARIARDVHHWREGAVDADGSSLGGRDASTRAHQLGIPCGGLSERDRQHCVETVNDVATDQ